MQMTGAVNMAGDKARQVDAALAVKAGAVTS